MTLDQVTPQRIQTAGAQAAEGARRQANQVTIPMAWRLGLGDFVRDTAVRTAKCDVLSYAGNVAFRVLLAIFPALIALLWLLNVLRAEGLVGTMIELTETAMPETASEPIKAMLSQVPEDEASGAFTFGALFSVLVAVWALAGMTRSMMVGLNAIYGVEEGRPFWRSTAVSLLLALAVAALLVTALFLIVFGSAVAERVADAVGLGVIFRWTWEIATWPVLVALVLVACALVYYVAPDVDQQFRWVSAGAVIATLLWLLFTVIYSIYVNRFASYQDVYGALAGIIVLMAYCYGSAIILLLGAVMNQVIEASHPAGKNDGERAPDRRRPETTA
jgi:membrane protein